MSATVVCFFNGSFLVSMSTFYDHFCHAIKKLDFLCEVFFGLCILTNVSGVHRLLCTDIMLSLSDSLLATWLISFPTARRQRNVRHSWLSRTRLKEFRYFGFLFFRLVRPSVCCPHLWTDNTASLGTAAASVSNTEHLTYTYIEHSLCSGARTNPWGASPKFGV